MAQESTPNPSARSEQQAAGQGSMGVYELAWRLASSLGGRLPVVVLTAMVVAGAFFWFREFRNVQQQLNDAQRTAEQARNEVLQEYSDKLHKLNVESADFSKRLEDLVSGQLDNMKKSEEQAAAQNEREKDLQKKVQDQQKSEYENNRAVLEAQKGQLESQVAEFQQRKADLQKQLDETNLRLQEAQKAAGLATYNDLIADISQQAQGSFINYNSLGIVQAKLDNPTILEQAKIDAANLNNPVPLRVVLNALILRKTSDRRYLDYMIALIEGNKSAATAGLVGLFSYYLPVSLGTGQLPLFVKWVLDSQLPMEFRDQLMSSSALYNSEGLQTLSPGELQEITKFAGMRMTRRLSGRPTSCPAVEEMLSQLNMLSPEAARTFAWSLSTQNIRGLVETDTQCIKGELQKAWGGAAPSGEAQRRWLGTETAPETSRSN